jgi:hypothetical protein
MKLVSFDVGIRNLAVCVMEGTCRSDVKILHWEVIDILGEQSGLNNPRCFKCSVNATYTHVSTAQMACSRHKPKQTKCPTKKALSSKTSDELQSLLVKFGLECPTKKKADMVTMVYLHYRQNIWRRCVKSAFSGSVIDLAPSIIKSLDGRMDVWRESDLIAFENQPDRRMFAVQAMMQMYFCCRGFRTEGVSATHKLSNIITIDDRVDSYKGRKKTGIVHAEALVPDPWKSHMLKHPKKDDLCDAFLQGLWVMEHK